MRANMQMVFQDPYDSLNPRIKVGGLVAEPLWLSGIMSRKEAERKVAEVFELVHLPADTHLRYAHQLSGGQQQRVGIARALATNPDLVVLDEPTSALDVSVQAQIINLLEEIRQRLSPAYLFISHDLSVVSNLSDRVAVMYLGQIVELGPTETIFELPGHPYTRGLISAAPVEHPAQQKERLALLGEPTSPVDPRPGCRLASRCPFVEPKCREGDITLREISPGHSVRCRRYVEEHVDGVWDPEPTGTS
jgi:oligopeptide/dipeptide ABC transporter ATP-binding protein